MIRVGSFVKVKSDVITRPGDNLANVAHKVYKVFGFEDGKANMKCFGKTAQRTIVLGVDLNDLVLVNAAPV